MEIYNFYFHREKWVISSPLNCFESHYHTFITFKMLILFHAMRILESYNFYKIKQLFLALKSSISFYLKKSSENIVADGIVIQIMSKATISFHWI